MATVAAAVLMPLVAVHMDPAYVITVTKVLFLPMQRTQNLVLHKHSIDMCLLERLLS